MTNSLEQCAKQVPHRGPRSWDEEAGGDRFDPASWVCSVCGKARPRESLHSKAILGQQQLVCAPSCLDAGRRANAR